MPPLPSPRLIPAALLLLSLSGAALEFTWAIPDVFLGGRFIGPIIPATPRFNANLTADFLEPANWQSGTLPGPWTEEPSLETTAVHRMTANPVLFGAVPFRVRSVHEDGELRSIAITYLDAGPYYGYRGSGPAGEEAERSPAERRIALRRHYRNLSTNLRSALETGCGRGVRTTLGRSNLLRESVTDYRWEDFGLRLSLRHEHSISLRLVRAEHLTRHRIDPELIDLRPEERAERLASHVVRTEEDIRLTGIPMFPQGNTPLCGIHSLAMTGHYLGLRVPTAGLAAAAGFGSGGTSRGANVLGVYRAVAEEVEMHLRTSSRFDPRRVGRSLEAGLPVIVWRRVSRERERAHAAHAERLARNPTLALPAPTRSDRAAWPPREKPGIPSHASIITGLSPDRSEVIYTEPWGEHGRDRRMRIEEMEATTYAAFFFRW